MVHLTERGSLCAPLPPWLPWRWTGSLWMLLPPHLEGKGKSGVWSWSSNFRKTHQTVPRSSRETISIPERLALRFFFRGRLELFCQSNREKKVARAGREARTGPFELRWAAKPFCKLHSLRLVFSVASGVDGVTGHVAFVISVPRLFQLLPGRPFLFPSPVRHPNFILT